MLIKSNKKINGEDIAKSFENNMKKINIIDLMDRIKKFRGVNLKELSIDDIVKQINSVLFLNGELQFLGRTDKYEKNTLLYRTRKLEEQDIYLLQETDFWHAPNESIEYYGRLNLPKELLLYTSPNMRIAYLEKNHNKGEYFLVSVYRANREFQVNCIGGEIDYNVLKITDEKAILTHKILNDFLTTEFTRDVGDGTEYLYKLSVAITKCWFDLPQPIQDAWAYPSMKDKNEYNVCFKPEIAKDILELKCGLIFRNDFPKEFPQKCAFNSITDGFNEYGTALHYRPGSPEQRNIFSQLNFS